MSGRLGSLTDTQLAITCAAFDADVTNVDTFDATITTLLDAYSREVQSVGQVTNEGPPLGPSTVGVRHAWNIETSQGERLAIVESLSGERGRHYRFLEWVAPELTQLAERRTIQLRGSVGMLRQQEVEGL